MNTGVQMNGIHRGRTDDRVGIAYVWHCLSPEHRDYLAAGGNGFRKCKIIGMAVVSSRSLQKLRFRRHLRAVTLLADRHY